MTPIEKRKAQLREYIEAREKATQGEWKVDPEHGQDVFANGEGRVLSSDPRWNYAPGKISCYNNLKFASKAANESALIAEQLLECIEALEEASKYSNQADIEGIAGKIADEALNKITGEK